MSSTLSAIELADLAPLAVAVPFGFAALFSAQLLFPFRRRHAEPAAAAVAVAVAGLLVLLLAETLDRTGPIVSRIGGWEPRAGGVVVGVNFAIDPIGASL